MKFFINEARADLVFDPLIEALRQHHYPFNQVGAVTPQDEKHLPSTLEIGTQAEALFHFFLCIYMKDAQDSNTAAQALGRLYDRRPHLFVPARLTHYSEEGLGRALLEVGLTMKTAEAARNWQENSRRLLERWEGDPRLIFTGVSDWQVAYERLLNDKKGGGFLGFQEKMASMLIYYLVDADLIKSFWYPPPVDFHMFRVLLATEVLVLTEAVPPEGVNVGKPVGDAVRKVTLEYCRSHDVSPEEFANATWLLSKLLCRRNPGNRTGKGEYKARSTELTPDEVTWTKAQLKRWEKGCGSCPIENLCRLNVPSANYYTWGKLATRGERPRPPQHQLFNISTHHGKDTVK